jgi:hypothetical protein
MKKIDYLCMLYIAALLAFGFDNEGSTQKTNTSMIESANRHQHLYRNQIAIAAHVAVVKTSGETVHNLRSITQTR